MAAGLARLRVPLGFATAAVALAMARPTWTSWLIGLPIAAAGEALRCWAAGHLDKSREITGSGPYRVVRHPLYLGSSFIGLGFILAANNLLVALVVVIYLAVTLAAAIRAEEAHLDEKFQGGYREYRAGRAAVVSRRFSWARLRVNREGRAIVGLVVGFAFLAWRAANPTIWISGYWLFAIVNGLSGYR
jgi:protein-S-isoprenylcysteine O-methyltransferase Ste14